MSTEVEKVTENTTENQRPKRDPAEDVKTIFIKGIPFSSNEDEVLKLDVFSKAVSMEISREVSDDKDEKDPKERKSKGFGYIKFENEADAIDAFENRFDAVLKDRKLFLDYVGEKAQFRSRGRYRGNFRGRGRGYNSRGYNRNGGFRGGRGGRGRGRGRGGRQDNEVKKEDGTGDK